MDWDVFISHAWEDRNFAGGLADALQKRGLRVWYDEFTLKVGDSLKASIDQGLANSRFGIVILSPNFFAKNWPRKELDGLMAREAGGEKVLLPVWHNVTVDEVAKNSPILADRIAVLTDKGIEDVVRTILKALLLEKESESQNLASRVEQTPLPGSGDERDEVFIVHGHDVAAREAVARFIEKIGACAIILDEQASRGKTVIEKFEAYSNVLFAVILLTPDDIVDSSSFSNAPRYRARQNVIFELGYFLGRLGRAHFCILYKPELEIPSDLQGLVYIELDRANGWKISLAQELRQAGVRIDLNRVLG